MQDAPSLSRISKYFATVLPNTSVQVRGVGTKMLTRDVRFPWDCDDGQWIPTQSPTLTRISPRLGYRLLRLAGEQLQGFQVIFIQDDCNKKPKVRNIRRSGDTSAHRLISKCDNTRCTVVPWSLLCQVQVIFNTTEVKFIFIVLFNRHCSFIIPWKQ